MYQKPDLSLSKSEILELQACVITPHVFKVHKLSLLLKQCVVERNKLQLVYTDYASLVPWSQKQNSVLFSGITRKLFLNCSISHLHLPIRGCSVSQKSLKGWIFIGCDWPQVNQREYSVGLIKKVQRKRKKKKAPLGFEPRISCLLDRRFNQLSHRALVKQGSFLLRESIGRQCCRQTL